MDLADRACPVCTRETPKLTDAALEEGLSALHPDWKLEEGRLVRKIPLPDFASALSLANRIGELAEQAQHHPDLLVRWGGLEVAFWTHAIGGLSEADLVMAARADRVCSGQV